MPTLKLAGFAWRVHSPSLLEYHGAYIGYDGSQWRVAVRDDPWGTRRFKSRQEAAQLVAGAFQQARAGVI